MLVLLHLLIQEDQLLGIPTGHGSEYLLIHGPISSEDSFPSFPTSSNGLLSLEDPRVPTASGTTGMSPTHPSDYAFPLSTHEDDWEDG